MKVYTHEVTAEILKKLSPEKQVLLVQLNRPLNEINILTKCSIFARNRFQRASGPERTAQRVMDMFFLRELAGKLWEGWKAIEKSYFKSCLSQKYDPHLDDVAQTALANLKENLKSGCVIADIRNKHTFHYDRERIEYELRRMKGDDSSSFLVGDGGGNYLGTLSEDLVTRAILRRFHDDEEAAMEKMFDEIEKVAGWFQDFAHVVVHLLIKEAMANAPAQVRAETLQNLPSIDSVELPFFVER